jgi:hypothetical protein
VYGTGSSAPNVVEANVVWNSTEGIYAVSDAIVRNNIVFNSGTGLSLYGDSQVDQMKNVTAVNNTLFNNDRGVRMSWPSTAINMVLANNAIYSPGKAALNAAGSVGSFAANYIEGSSDRSLDGSAFIAGGSSANAFVDPASANFWPKGGSPLLNVASGGYAPAADFNTASRVSPFDVGAYETNGLTSNPGWAIKPEFKTVGTVAPPPSSGYSLSASPNPVNPQGTVTVAWSKPAGAGDGFIGLYTSNSAGAYSYLQFRYPPSGVNSGTVQFVAPASAGTYWLGWVKEGESGFKATASFAVGSTASGGGGGGGQPASTSYSLSPGAAVVQPGSTVTVSWTKPSGSKDGFIGLYNTSPVSEYSYLQYRYGASGANSGTVQFVAPSSPGTYWLGWVSEGEYGFKATASFSVSF